MRRSIATGLAMLASLGLGQSTEQGKEQSPESRPIVRPADRITRFSDLPSGEGYAARYPGDLTIQKDSRTLFSEDFEGRDPFVGWTDRSSTTNVRLADTMPNSGNAALSIIADTKGVPGGHLFKRLRFGQDVLFVRFYVRFHSPCEYIQHFVQISADSPPRGFPLGGEGVCPDGGARFATAIEPFGARAGISPPGGWRLHSSWCEMAISDDARYWGNDFEPAEPTAIEPDRWTCVEVMVKANSTPTSADGAQAFWIDGRLVAGFEGFRWRTDAKLKLNGVNLRFTMNDAAAVRQGSPDPKPTATVSFDDVVVATRYIGPRAPLPPPVSGMR